MTKAETADIADIKFTSPAFPTPEDVKLWNSLSPEQQRAILVRELDAAEAGGLASEASITELLKRARAETVS